MILTCEDFKRAGLWNTANCCSSCHEDDELGYDMLEMNPEPYKHREQRIWAYVCCAHKLARHYSRDDWALAVRTKRNYLLTTVSESAKIGCR